MKRAFYMVGVTELKLNKALVEFLREHPTLPPSRSRVAKAASIACSYRSRNWRIKDKLSEQDIEELIRAFQAGTAKWRLAERYGIGIKSVKHILQERGIRKPSGWNPRE